MKKIALLLTAVFMAAFLLTGCSSSSSQAVGVLDTARVMTESAKVKALQEELNVKGKELTDNLEKEKANLSQEEFQKKQEQSYGEFLKIKQDLEKQIDDSIQQSLTKIAQEKKLGVILYKNGVAQGGTDITEDVIKSMQ